MGICYMEEQLRSHVESQRSYIRDTNDFLDKLKYHNPCQ